MSITSRIDPTGLVSIQDNLWHIATSSQSGSVNFKYVFDVYNDEGTQLVRVKNYPDPSNGKGYFDAGNVVRNLITYDWFTPERLVNSTNLNDLRSMFVKVPDTSGEVGASYRISVGEDYASAGVQITDLNLSSGIITAYNYLPKLFNRRKFTLANKSLQYLSNRPLRARFDKAQDNHLFIPLIVDVNSPGSFDLTVNVYNGSNTSTASDTIANDIGTGSLMFQLDIGSKAVNETLNWFKDDDPLVDYMANMAYYTVSFQDYVFRVDLVCSANENISLHFMNAFGMFETVIFTGANRLNMNVTRKSFEQNEYRYGASSVNYFNADNVYYEGKTNYSQNIQHGYKLTYANPDTEEWAWLSELIYSPQIYMEKDGNFIPVTIKNSNYQYNEVRYDRLKNLEIEIEINQNISGFLR